ncbi:hypothetical protein [Citricoccus sp. NR2]|uniref:hypothetical protein n=1 Tax=Citricoccus sp. NR2 TaxID=3004095 RepID=UPI0022DD58C0|nr:hypothetical protein [Citricoccus sp. NR2]WBL18778.1 hypothetical protein O1A05_13630 [Citricoccus sp. NR2]
MPRSRVTLPEQDYLARIGEIAYTVSYLEWTILGDLQRLEGQLPNDFVLSRLEPMMTSQIASAVKSASKVTAEDAVKDYLVAVYNALFVAADLRNDVLHARPATHPDQGQRLNRAEVRDRKTTGKRFWIDNEWLDTAITELNEQLSAVSQVRPPVTPVTAEAR